MSAVPKVPPFQIVGDRLKFYNVDNTSIAKVKGFRAGINERQIRILSGTILPDRDLRMDLMFETADDIETCAKVLETQISSTHVQTAPYVYHFEIFPNRVQQIHVPRETFFLEILPGQMDQIVEIAKQARVMEDNSDEAAATMDNIINGEKRADARMACKPTLANRPPNADENGNHVLKVLEEITGGDGEYLTDEELRAYHGVLYRNEIPEEAPNPHERTVVGMDHRGQIKFSTAVLVTDPAEKEIFYDALVTYEDPNK